MKSDYKYLLAGILVVIVVVIALIFLLLLQDDNNGGGDSSEPNNQIVTGPDVTLTLTSNKTTYSQDEQVVINYVIKNNEDTNLSLTDYRITINLVIGSNQVMQIYELTEMLEPGEEIKGSVDVNNDMEPGEHKFEMELLERIGENRYLQHQCKELIIKIE